MLAEALAQQLGLLGATAGEQQVQAGVAARARRNASASRSIFFSLLRRPA